MFVSELKRCSFLVYLVINRLLLVVETFLEPGLLNLARQFLGEDSSIFLSLISFKENSNESSIKLPSRDLKSKKS